MTAGAANAPTPFRRGIEQPVPLAVEGLDYLHALRQFISGKPEFATVQLWDFCDVAEPKRWLRLFPSLGDFRDRVRAIGFVRDAEESAAAKVDQLRGAFAACQLPVPDAPLALALGPPVTGFVVVPHGQPSGCLEHAMLDAVLSDASLACARAFLSCVDRPNRNENWRAKVQVHALIAGSEKPPMTLGQSVRHGQLWDFSGPSLRVMTDFILDPVRAATPPSA